MKVDGRRAYKLARQGETVELKPRPIVVYRLAVRRYEYPELVLEIECGSGTYVRSLGRDLAASLGTAAVMSALVRRAIGGFRIEESVSPDVLTKDSWHEHLLPALRAVESLPLVELSDDELQRIRQGLAIAREGFSAESEDSAAVDSTGRLVAILTRRGPGQLAPRRNLLP